METKTRKGVYWCVIRTIRRGQSETQSIRRTVLNRRPSDRLVVCRGVARRYWYFETEAEALAFNMSWASEQWVAAGGVV